MVCRTYPIRVKSPPDGSSGPLPGEVDWGVVSERSGIPREELEKVEVGSVSGNLRRVGEFDWVYFADNFPEWSYGYSADIY